MPLLGFTMFRDKILSGEKDQTIRKLRKHPIKVGDKLHLYWKLRTKQCEKLGEGICTEIFLLHISPSAFIIGDQRLSSPELETLARLDGFASFYDLVVALQKMHHIDTESGFFQVVRWGRLEKKEA
jgi:hypothetical protein